MLSLLHNPTPNCPPNIKHQIHLSLPNVHLSTLIYLPINTTLFPVLAKNTLLTGDLLLQESNSFIHIEEPMITGCLLPGLVSLLNFDKCQHIQFLTRKGWTQSVDFPAMYSTLVISTPFTFQYHGNGRIQ